MPKRLTFEAIDLKEVAMGDLVSRVPELLEQRGWNAMDLIRRGLTYNTAYRVARGETEITLKIAKQLCDIFEVSSIDQIFRYTPTAEGARA